MRGLAVAALMATGLPMSAVSTRATGARPLVVRAVGDSYTAGTGGLDKGYIEGDNKRCFKNSENWVGKWVGQVKSAGVQVDYQNLACSGAVIQHGFTANGRESRPVVTVGKFKFEELHVAVVDGFGGGYVYDIDEQERVKLLQSKVPFDKAQLAKVKDGCTAAGYDLVAQVRKDLMVKYTIWADPPVASWSDLVLSTVGNTVQANCVPGPQLRYLYKKVDVVMTTMGGNDLGFPEVFGRCFAGEFAGAIKGAHCREYFDQSSSYITDNGDMLGDKKKDERSLTEQIVIDQHGTKIGDLTGWTMREAMTAYLTTIAERINPNGWVVLLGYPGLVQPNGGLSQELRDRQIKLTTLQADIVKQVNDNLEASTGRRPILYNGGAIDYFTGHETLDTFGDKEGDRWIKEPTDATQSNATETIAHPNDKGYAALACLALAALPVDAAAHLAGVDPPDLTDPNVCAAPIQRTWHGKRFSDQDPHGADVAFNASGMAFNSLPGDSCTIKIGVGKPLDVYLNDPNVPAWDKQVSGHSLAWVAGCGKTGTMIVGTASGNPDPMDSSSSATLLSVPSLWTHNFTELAEQAATPTSPWQPRGVVIYLADAARNPSSLDEYVLWPDPLGDPQPQPQPQATPQPQPEPLPPIPFVVKVGTSADSDVRLGVVLDPTTVIESVNARLGSPSSDSGWLPPTASDGPMVDVWAGAPQDGARREVAWGTPPLRVIFHRTAAGQAYIRGVSFKAHGAHLKLDELDWLATADPGTTPMSALTQYLTEDQVWGGWFGTAAGLSVMANAENGILSSVLIDGGIPSLEPDPTPLSAYCRLYQWHVVVAEGHPDDYDHNGEYVWAEEAAALSAALEALGYQVTMQHSPSPELTAAVRTFQAEHGLSADGAAGPDTLNAVEQALGCSPLPTTFDEHQTLYGFAKRTDAPTVLYDTANGSASIVDEMRIWLDSGTPTSDAFLNSFLATIPDRTGMRFNTCLTFEHGKTCIWTGHPIGIVINFLWPALGGYAGSDPQGDGYVVSEAGAFHT